MPVVKFIVSPGGERWRIPLAGSLQASRDSVGQHLRTVATYRNDGSTGKGKLVMGRRAQSPELGFGSDSFLDVICNIVGILIILIVIVAVKVERQPLG